MKVGGNKIPISESYALSISCVMFAERGSPQTQRADDERAAFETWTLKRVAGGWSRGYPALVRLSLGTGLCVCLSQVLSNQIVQGVAT